jgi:tetratricopeptide (TPR) repeat protein
MLTFKTCAHDKNILKDFERALEFLNKNYVIEPNIAHILKSYGYVKMVLNDYQGALEDLDKANFFASMHLLLEFIKMSKGC